MLEKQLGKLTQIKNLREQWPDEAGDFTPWLAREENLAILGETLGIELELEAREKSVGSFSADILCKDIGSNAWVLIENQLNRTDHTHLGQLLTYASGLEAVTIIWIAARFTEEHRSTLDWLNKITDEDFRFFGLEVELWCIGDSPRAPKFNIVSKPNDWSRSVARAAREETRGELSDTRTMQLAYWTAFLLVLDKVDGLISGNRTPQAQGWMPFSIGKTDFRLDAVITLTRQEIRAELYIGKDNAKAFFHLLQKQQQEIEEGLGYPLVWGELPDSNDCRISIYLYDADPANEEDWARQHGWLAEKLNELHRVFHDRIKQLDPDDWYREQEESNSA